MGWRLAWACLVMHSQAVFESLAFCFVSHRLQADHSNICAYCHDYICMIYRTALPVPRLKSD